MTIQITDDSRSNEDLVAIFWISCGEYVACRVSEGTSKRRSRLRDGEKARRKAERAAANQAGLAAHVAKVVAGFPPLSPEQANTIATLLRPYLPRR